MPIDFGTDGSFTKAGTTTLLGMSTIGITKPLLPAFSSYGVAGAAAASYVIFPSTLFNTGSCYNASNGRFTAPVAGTYYFYFQHINTGIAGEYRFNFYKNDNWYGGGCYIIQSYSANYLSVVCSQHVALAANDYVNVYYISGPGAMYAGAGDYAYGQFSGYLVG